MNDVGPLYARMLTEIGVAHALVLPQELNHAEPGSPLAVCVFELMEEFSDLGSNERQLKRLLAGLHLLVGLELKHLEQGWFKDHQTGEMDEAVTNIQQVSELMDANIRCILKLANVRRIIKRSNSRLV